LWEKGTWEVVQTPPCTVPLPCTRANSESLAYNWKVKTDREGDLPVLELKARVCVFDVQFQWALEYNNVYSESVLRLGVRAAQSGWHWRNPFAPLSVIRASPSPSVPCEQ
jgi:hypothetical protein